MIKIKYLEWAMFVLYLILVLLEIKRFTVWPQITVILSPTDMQGNVKVLGDLIVSIHPHLLRTFLISPFYFISYYFSLNLELLFSITLTILVFSIYFLNMDVLKGSVDNKRMFVILVFYLSLSLFMNGRIIFAMLGNALLLNLLYKVFYTPIKISKSKFFFVLISSLLLVSVSSGTFMVFLLSIFVFYILYIFVNLPNVNKRILAHIVFFIIGLTIISPMIIVFIEKNLNYFDGSFFNMLSHGVGGYLLGYLYFVFPLLLLSIPFVFLSIKNNKVLIPLVAMITSSLCVGLFGFSSLLSAVPAYVVFIFMYGSTKTRHFNRKFFIINQ